MTKMLVVPLDGSKNSMRSLVFLRNQFGLDDDLKIVLLHILPALPAILVEESIDDPETKQKLEAFQEKNELVAEKMLLKAKRRLIDQGYAETNVDTALENRLVGIARDICAWTTDSHADAIIVSSSGHSKLESFFIGEIANKLVEFCRAAPVWLVKGKPRGRDVLLAVDDSENAVRAAIYTGRMLSGTPARITLFQARCPFNQIVNRDLIDAFPALKERWHQAAGDNMDTFLQNAKEALMAAGVSEAQMEIKVLEDSRSTADDILETAAIVGAGSVVLGCKGQTNAVEYAIGSTTQKVVNKAENITVCTVP